MKLQWLAILSVTVMACGGSASPPRSPAPARDGNAAGGSSGGSPATPTGGAPSSVDAAVNIERDAAMGSGEIYL
jgi:hypothetical protein